MRQILSLLLFLSLAIVGVAQNTPYTSALSPNPFPYRWVRVFEFAGNQVCYDGYGVGITDDNRCVVSFWNQDRLLFQKESKKNDQKLFAQLSIYSMSTEGNIIGNLIKMDTFYQCLVSIYKDSVLFYQKNYTSIPDTLSLFSSDIKLVKKLFFNTKPSEKMILSPYYRNPILTPKYIVNSTPIRNSEEDNTLLSKINIKDDILDWEHPIPSLGFSKDILPTSDEGFILMYHSHWVKKEFNIIQKVNEFGELEWSYEKNAAHRLLGYTHDDDGNHYVLYSEYRKNNTNTEQYHLDKISSLGKMMWEKKLDIYRNQYLDNYRSNLDYDGEGHLLLLHFDVVAKKLFLQRYDTEGVLTSNIMLPNILNDDLIYDGDLNFTNKGNQILISCRVKNKINYKIKVFYADVKDLLYQDSLIKTLVPPTFAAQKEEVKDIICALNPDIYQLMKDGNIKDLILPESTSLDSVLLKKAAANWEKKQPTTDLMREDLTLHRNGFDKILDKYTSKKLNRFMTRYYDSVLLKLNDFLPVFETDTLPKNGIAWTQLDYLVNGMTVLLKAYNTTKDSASRADLEKRFTFLEEDINAFVEDYKTLERIEKYGYQGKTIDYWCSTNKMDGVLDIAPPPTVVKEESPYSRKYLFVVNAVKDKNKDLNDYRVYYCARAFRDRKDITPKRLDCLTSPAVDFIPVYRYDVWLTNAKGERVSDYVTVTKEHFENPCMGLKINSSETLKFCLKDIKNKNQVDWEKLLKSVQTVVDKYGGWYFYEMPMFLNK